MKNEHPEDRIFKVKSFLNELSNVENKYFENLARELKLTEEGTDFLFDYIYNNTQECDDFQHYLDKYNCKYEQFVKAND
jgi:hypothetical protein